MEEYLAISKLNDFIFCPISIYYHNLYGDLDKSTFQSTDQINGTHIHETVDNQMYSTRKSVLQGVSVLCEQYGLYGKIDLFDTETGIITERKKHIVQIFDGYIFQLYAQYFALTEEGYYVRGMNLYSYDDNKRYPVELPQNNPEMLNKFVQLISDINSFNPDDFVQKNAEKCARCIYAPLCDRVVNSYVEQK